MGDKAMRDALLATFIFTTLLGLLVGMSAMAEAKKHKDQFTKISQQLEDEQLKRDYFEWRESNATGHSKSKEQFPRYDELQRMNEAE